MSQTGDRPALPEANRTLPPIAVEVKSTSMGLQYEAWPHDKNDVAFGWSRKPTALEVHRAGRVHRILPKRIPGDRPGEFFLIYRTPADVDGWLVREKLLAIRTPEEALEFLRDTGPLVPRVQRKDRRRGRPPVEITFSELQLVQRYVRDYLTHGIAPELDGVFKSSFLYAVVPRWVNGLRMVVLTPHEARGHYHGPPLTSIWSDCGLKAICATILLDHAWGKKFRCCRREDCGRVFRVRDPRKVFCSYRCAHLVVVRKSRKPKKRGRRSR